METIVVPESLSNKDCIHHWHFADDDKNHQIAICQDCAEKQEYGLNPNKPMSGKRIKGIDKNVICKSDSGNEFFGDKVSYCYILSDNDGIQIVNGKRAIFGGYRYARTDEDDYREEETYENDDLGNEEFDFETILPEEWFKEENENEIQNELRQRLTEQQLGIWNQFTEERKKDKANGLEDSLNRNLTYVLNKVELDKIKSILHQVITDYKLKQTKKGSAQGKEEVLSIVNNFRIIDLTPYNAVRFFRGEKDRIIPYFDEGTGDLQNPQAGPILALSCGRVRLNLDKPRVFSPLPPNYSNDYPLTFYVGLFRYFDD